LCLFTFPFFHLLIIHLGYNTIVKFQDTWCIVKLSDYFPQSSFLKTKIYLQTVESHDRAVIIKRFLFEMIDAYGCLAYLGFVLADRDALRSLLLTMLMTDSVRRLILECLIPLIQYRLRVRLHRRATGQRKREQDADTSDSPDSPPISLDRDACADPYEPFDDYLEMILLHGYLAVFAFVSPSLAAPIALISTVLESHFDAFKLMWITQRPTPRLLVRQTSIWLALLAAQAWLSILTNVGLWISGLTVAHFDLSTISPSLLYLLLEHALVATGLIIHFGIADTPVDVRDARRARAYRQNLEFPCPFNFLSYQIQYCFLNFDNGEKLNTPDFVPLCCFSMPDRQPRSESTRNTLTPGNAVRVLIVQVSFQMTAEFPITH
uniref:Anoctamin n=1 Tax=Echinostoma caproni TaxID=27848 RepID=A0A183ARU9_9TREM